MIINRYSVSAFMIHQRNHPPCDRFPQEDRPANPGYSRSVPPTKVLFSAQKCTFFKPRKKKNADFTLQEPKIQISSMFVHITF